MDYIVS